MGIRYKPDPFATANSTELVNANAIDARPSFAITAETLLTTFYIQSSST